MPPQSRFLSALFFGALFFPGCAAEISSQPPPDAGASVESTPGPAPGRECDGDDDVGDGCKADAPGDPDAGPGDSTGEVELPLFFIGDCVTATCPADAPYPVGCAVLFTPGDDRGCVASTPTDSTVYFQAGDECDKGLVVGTLTCAPSPGPALGPASCPINKPVSFYPESVLGCPEIQD